MHPPSNVFLDAPTFHTVWEQIQLLTGLTSQHQLAQALGIADSAVTDAKKRGYFPLNWAYRLAKSHHLSLDEILLTEHRPSLSSRPSEGGPIYIDSALQLVEEALTTSGQHISDKQKQALVDIVREELKGKTLKIVKALKE